MAQPAFCSGGAGIPLCPGSTISLQFTFENASAAGSTSVVAVVGADRTVVEGSVVAEPLVGWPAPQDARREPAERSAVTTIHLGRPSEAGRRSLRDAAVGEAATFLEDLIRANRTTRVVPSLYRTPRFASSGGTDRFDAPESAAHAALILLDR